MKQIEFNFTKNYQREKTAMDYVPRGLELEDVGDLQRGTVIDIFTPRRKLLKDVTPADIPRGLTAEDVAIDYIK